MPTNIYKTITDYPTLTSILSAAAKQADKFVKGVNFSWNAPDAWAIDNNKIVLIDTSAYRLVSYVRLLTVTGIYGPILLQTGFDRPVSWNIVTELLIGRKDQLSIGYEIEKFKTEAAYTFVQF